MEDFKFLLHVGRAILNNFLFPSLEITIACITEDVCNDSHWFEANEVMSEKFEPSCNGMNVRFFMLGKDTRTMSFEDTSLCLIVD